MKRLIKFSFLISLITILSTSCISVNKCYNAYKRAYTQGYNKGYIQALDDVEEIFKEAEKADTVNYKSDIWL